MSYPGCITELQSKALVELETPFYLYNLDELRERLDRFRRSVPAVDRIFFAIMANYNRDVLRVIISSKIGLFGHGIEHVNWALRCGAQPSDIVCATTNLRERECAEFAHMGTFCFANSITQFRHLQQHNCESAGLRVNVGDLLRWAREYGMDHDPAPRIGVDPSEILQLPKKDQREIKGLHFYAGTNIARDEWYVTLLESIYKLTAMLPSCEVIDFGGGFGIGYDTDGEFNLVDFNSDLQSICSKYRDQSRIQIWCEPGRFLMAPCGMMVATVTDVINRGNIRYVGVDTSVTAFPRHLLANASGAPVAILGRAAEPELGPVRICGSTTYSADYLTTELGFGKVEVGDRLIFTRAGAYQYSMAMDFLGRTRPAEYVIENGQLTLSRPPCLPAGYAGYLNEL